VFLPHGGGTVEHVFVSKDEAPAALDRALGLVAAADIEDAAAGEWAVAVQQRLNALEAIATGAFGRFDVVGEYEGAHGSIPWLAYKCRLPKSVVKRRVANARGVRRMPETEAAFERGDINASHVRELVGALNLSPERFAKAEEELVASACTHRYDKFHRDVQYWRQAAEPDRVEDDAQAQHDARHLHASRSFEGCVVIDGVLDAVGGSIYLNELQRLETILFKADWAAAEKRLGRDPYVHDLDRTPAQRRADAAELMAERSAAKAPGAVEPRVLLHVLVGYETFAGRVSELADGTVLTPGQVVSLLNMSDVQRVVFDGPSNVIDIGAKQRLFRGATRTAVQLRDLECQAHPSCDVRFPDCETDHLQPASWDGPTITTNGGLKCRWHHRRRGRAP
jgi:hypothetical protein